VIWLKYGAARVVAVHSYDELTNDVAVTLEDRHGERQEMVLCLAALAADGGTAEIIGAATRRLCNGQPIEGVARNHAERGEC
jgi:hypothetical protein